SHLPLLRLTVEWFSSSTWGRADQQTPGTLTRVWAFCFARESPPASARFVRAIRMARPGHSRFSRAGLQLFSSSTWGRADQQTPGTLTRVWGVLFCARKFLEIPNCKAGTIPSPGGGYPRRLDGGRLDRVTDRPRGSSMPASLARREFLAGIA